MSTIADVVNSSSAAAGTSSTSGGSAKLQQGSAESFLKLLVTQMQNQDPLNPTDNAQITSQIAQINTVSGIDKLNTSIAGLGTQLVQMQAMQAASLINKDVLVAGKQLTTSADGKTGVGAFELSSAASKVVVEVLDGAGNPVDSFTLTEQSAGRHEFAWDPALRHKELASGQTFRVTATSGSTTVDSTALMHDRIDAVSTSGSTLQLALSRSGNVAYGDIKAFN